MKIRKSILILFAVLFALLVLAIAIYLNSTQAEDARMKQLLDCQNICYMTKASNQPISECMKVCMGDK